MRRSSILSGCLAALLVTAAGAAGAGPSNAHYARGTENVFWFIHVSDIHIGSPLYGDHKAHAQLVLTEAVDVIQPWFVVATGDLVDGALNSIPTLGQSQKEWDDYIAIYETAGMTPDFFFDLPGNHDGYGDVGMDHYLANSLLGRTHDRLYTSWTVEIPAGEYLFFGLNSAGNGSGSFFEDPEFTTDEIEELEQTLQSHASARLAFLLGHHGLNGPANGGQVSAALEAAGGGYYLHGHEHEYEEYLASNDTIVVNQVDSLAAADHNNLGVGVVDHDAFIYRATGTTTPWPHVMVTAPVGIDLRDGGQNPYAYEVCKDRADNPIRAMVFVDTAPTEVSAQVGTAPAVSMTPSASSPNLWTAEVDTTGLVAGVHDVTVTATVGGETSFHKIRTTFVDGPCDVLSEDPPPPPVPDAGVPDAESDATVEGGAGGESGSGGSAGAAGTGGSAGGTAGSGGTTVETDAGSGGEAGASGQAGGVSADAASEDGGCSCASAGSSAPKGAGVFFGLAALTWFVGRRRRR
jgi:MYXO-CTERM domain-containing protein